MQDIIIAAKHLSAREKRVLPLVLGNLHKGVSPELKLRMYEILLLLRSRREPFGMLIVLGWRREWNGLHASVPDAEQDLFERYHFSFCSHSTEVCVERIGRTVRFDGAILVSREGTVTASGVYLEDVSAKRIAKKLHGNRAEDLSEAFGFETKVHTRHLAAIAASFILKGTTIFTVSEEDGSVRMFERGRIMWSTVAKEAARIAREIES